MADQAITLKVVTPQRLVLNLTIDSLVVPATEGYLGVLKNHAPLVTGLVPGVVTYKTGGQETKLAVGGGILEVAGNLATILADTAETPEEINLERARRAKERAEERLKNRPQGLDVARAELALRRAIARIKAGER